MKITSLDGLVVHRPENPSPVRLHAPRWWRIDRHIAWILTPANRKAVVVIRYLGDSGRVESRDVFAVVK